MGQLDDERLEAAKDLRVRAMANATRSAHAGIGYVPTPERWAEDIQAERARQREGEYTPEHDREHGVDHLLRWSQDYARRGKRRASAALVEAAREQLLALVVELNRARENGTVFTYGEIQRRLMGSVPESAGRADGGDLLDSNGVCMCCGGSPHQPGDPS